MIGYISSIPRLGQAGSIFSLKSRVSYIVFLRSHLSNTVNRSPLSTMASPSQVVLETQTPLVLAFNQREDSAKKTSDLLQKNYEMFHVYFNDMGFHNHILHHILTLYALGASPDEVQAGFDHNTTYQRPAMQASARKAKELSDPKVWKECLGNEDHYSDFVLHFQQDMEASSFNEVLHKYLFAGDERANDMLVRLYAGLVHPVIHLGFAMEFQQPLILAEALAQAAVHDNAIGKILLPSERAAKQSGRKTMDRSIASLVDEAAENPKLKSHGALVEHLAQVVVGEDEIEERMAEMMNASCMYRAHYATTTLMPNLVYLSAAAQRSQEVGRSDFFLLHCVTSAIFYPAMLGPDSPLSIKDKVRLLEYKIRVDLGMYISCDAPALHMDRICAYKPKHPGGWEGVFKRVRAMTDDGHTNKYIRAIAATQHQSKKYESDKERFRLRGDDCLLMGHAVMDSAEVHGENMWTRPSPVPFAML